MFNIKLIWQENLTLFPNQIPSCNKYLKKKKKKDNFLKYMWIYLFFKVCNWV